MLAVFVLMAMPQDALGQSRWTAAPEVRRGGHQDIMADVRSASADLTVVNMWATWCAPCIEEFPNFVRLAREDADRGLRVVFVSLDMPEDETLVAEFLKGQGWYARAYLKTGKDNEFINAFSTSWSGALPATFVYDASGALVDQWESGPVSYEELARRVRDRYVE